MHRFFFLIMTIIFSYHLFSINRNEHRKVRAVNAEVKKILMHSENIERLENQFNQKNFLCSKVDIPLERRLYKVAGHELLNDSLYLYLMDLESSDTIRQKFPLRHISQADKQSVYLDKDLRIRWHLCNKQEFDEFWSLFEELRKQLKLQDLCFETIFTHQGHYKFPKDRIERNKQSTRAFKRAKIIFLHKELTRIFALFKREHSIFNPNRLRQDGNPEFIKLAGQFISLLSEEPSLIACIDLETVTNFIKQIALPINSEMLEPLSDFALDNTRIILKFLNREIDACGHRIKYLFHKGVVFDKEEIFELLRQESDIMHLSVFIENAEIGTGVDMQEDPSQRGSSTLYNFNYIKYICQSHVFLLLTLLKTTNPQDWKTITENILSEAPDNLRKKIDFFPPVGRWSQAGRALEGHLKIAKRAVSVKAPTIDTEEIAARQLEFEAQVIRGTVEQKAIELFHSNKDYETIMKELSPNVPGYKFSYIEVLSIICPDNLKSFVKKYRSF